MAYTRKSEKLINITIGAVIGVVLTVIILLYVLQQGEYKKQEVNANVLGEEIIKTKDNNKFQNTESNSNEQEIPNANAIFENDTRIQDYDMIRLPSNLKGSDYIDVRIKRITGEDYIVLAKKEVLEVEGGVIWLKINNTERQKMNRAIVETVNDKSSIYATVYIDKDKQATPDVNY